MRFSWDLKKDLLNQRDHDITFQEATTVFGDALAITVADHDHSIDEERFITVGQSSYGRLLVVRSEEHTSELQSRLHLECRLLLEKKKIRQRTTTRHGDPPFRLMSHCCHDSRSWLSNHTRIVYTAHDFCIVLVLSSYNLYTTMVSY